MRIVVPLSVAVAVALLTACPGSLEDPDRFSGVACSLIIDVEQDIFVTRCGDQQCHGAGPSPAGNLDLTSPNIRARLIDIPSRGCGGVPLVGSASPNESAMIDRLLEEPECGLRMPLGADALSPAEVDCVRSWVFEAVAGSAGLEAEGL